MPKEIKFSATMLKKEISGECAKPNKIQLKIGLNSATTELNILTPKLSSGLMKIELMINLLKD
jgi:hypothetical protein